MRVTMTGIVEFTTHHDVINPDLLQLIRSRRRLAGPITAADSLCVVDVELRRLAYGLGSGARFPAELPRRLPVICR